jgi:hypothetical protein
MLAFEGRDLARADTDCASALTLAQDADARASALAARAVVRLRQGRPADVLADSGDAVNLDARSTDGLYMRGLARLRSGDASGAADITAAAALDAKIARTYGVHGLSN